MGKVVDPLYRGAVLAAEGDFLDEAVGVGDALLLEKFGLLGTPAIT